MSANGMPSSLSTICDHVVAWPCPCADEPVMTVAVPVGCSRTIDDSQPPEPTPMAWVTADGASPQISTQVESPMPRWLPRLLASARRASKPE